MGNAEQAPNTFSVSVCWLELNGEEERKAPVSRNVCGTEIEPKSETPGRR